VKDDLPYFEHDNDALGGDREQALMAQYSFEGYGRFWALSERIAAAPGAVLDISTKVIKNGLASYLRMTTADLDAFLKFLSDPEECGLISFSDGKLTSERIQKSYQRVVADRVAAQERWNRKKGAGAKGAGEGEPKKTEDPKPSTEDPKTSPEVPQTSPESDRSPTQRTNEGTNEVSSFGSGVKFEPPVGAHEAPPSGSTRPSPHQARAYGAVVKTSPQDKAEAHEFIRSAVASMAAPGPRSPPGVPA